MPSPLSAGRLHGCVAKLVSFARNIGGVDWVAICLASGPIDLETFAGPARHHPTAVTRFDSNGDATELGAHGLGEADLLGVHLGRIRVERQVDEDAGLATGGSDLVVLGLVEFAVVGGDR